MFINKTKKKLPSVKENVEQLDFSYIAGRNANGIATLEHSLAGSYKLNIY